MHSLCCLWKKRGDVKTQEKEKPGSRVATSEDKEKPGSRVATSENKEKPEDKENPGSCVATSENTESSRILHTHVQ